MERRRLLASTATAMAAVALLVIAVPSSATTAFAVPPRRGHRRATAYGHPLASVPPEASSSSPDGVAATAADDDSSPRSGGATPSTVGPRDPGARRRRPERARRRGGPGATAAGRRAGTVSRGHGGRTGPRPTSPSPRKRAPHQFDHTTETAWSRTDKTAAELVAGQVPNEDAPTLTLSPADDDGGCRRGEPIRHPHFETVSLDDLFPGIGFSDKFSSSTSFRDDVRRSMREDVFNTTPAYANMSEKARRMLLLPDSSLQGSWRCREEDDGEGQQRQQPLGRRLRMKELTRALGRHLGEGAPTGDEFMEAVGSLCGSGPRTHWIDIVGLTGRTVPHSWHQDTGRPSPDGDAVRTVLLGFPPGDDYDGTGVFSHVVGLDRERLAPGGHPPDEPVLYGGGVGEEFVVRPRYARGREILVYRDVDVLHSAPDVAHRTSVMRFM